MREQTGYRLWDGVQVREERFGLLFYDYRGPKLHFLPSRDLIDERFFQGRTAAHELVDALCVRYGEAARDAIGPQVRRVLDMLVAKGLIYEQPIC